MILHHLVRAARLAGLATAAAVLAAVAAVPAIAQEDGQFDHIAERARALAQEDHAPAEAPIPAALSDISYDDYRDIRFRKDHALWHGEAMFEVQFFHMGFLYDEPVMINVIENGEARRLDYDREMFDFGKNEFEEPLPADLGFAGFRLHYPLNSAEYKDELAVFLGASYFRVLGRGQNYGISARGLAIDTAMDSGEEFPVFREFWLVKPEPEASVLTVYALLDSNSVTGAYRFDIRPGEDTVIDVRVRLFARADVQRLGMAPLTSMFLYGEQRLRKFDDFRPEVHDSDGLLMRTGAGEWLWRPLENPRTLQVFSMQDENPRGFGLMQRDRAFSHYLDTESHFETRPSMWIEPRGDWGRGGVHLVQIPTSEEVNDNIVSFWVPGDRLAAGDTRDFAYRLHTTTRPVLDGTMLGHAERTHTGWAAVPGSREKPSRAARRFVIDFVGGPLDTLGADQPVEAKLEINKGEVEDLIAQKLPDGGWRASFRLEPEGTERSDMRLHLEHRGERLTETWSYVWSPDAVE